MSEPTKQATRKKPAAKSPAAKSPAAKSPAAKSPAAKSPAAKKPAAKKPAAKKPAAKKPLAKKPAAKKPATTMPAARAARATKRNAIGAAGVAQKGRLPAALVERAEAEVAAKRARVAKDARADIALILRRRERIAEDFYDIGEALVRLKRPGVAEALGRVTFRDVCTKDLSMSLTAAEALIAIVSGVARQDALRMGQERALALVQLAKATPEADTAAMLQRGTRRLPSGKRVDLEKATAREIHAAAKELRGAGQTSARPKGRTTTSEERARAASLQASLVAAGVPRARVTAVATKPGQEADVRIDGVPLSALPQLRIALGKRA